MPIKTSKTTAKKGFDQLLEKITLKEYQEFITQYAAKYKTFKTDFELWFADKDESVDVAKKYESLMTALARKYSDRGFINYRGGMGFAAEVNGLLATGNNLVAKHDFRKAFMLQQAVLKKTMEVITYCDDSSGSIGGIVIDVIEQMDNIIESHEAAMDLKEQMFDFLAKELKDPIYFDYGDFGYELFLTYRILAVKLGNSSAFLELLDSMITRSTGKYDSYKRQFFITQKIEFLRETGKTNEADAMVVQNLDIVDLRLQEVNKAVKLNNMPLAKKLIAEGINIAKQNNHYGTINQWEQELLRIAIIEKDTDTVRFYTKKFAFGNGVAIEYYRQWKKTFTAAEWNSVLEQHIAETTKKVVAAHERIKPMWRIGQPPLLNALAPIFIEEQYWERLLDLVKKEDNLDRMLRYHEYLAKPYPEQMIELYVPAMAIEGDSASAREHYAALARKMKKVMKDIPASQEKIISLVHHLKQKYPRKPAMQEELNKVLK